MTVLLPPSAAQKSFANLMRQNAEKGTEGYEDRLPGQSILSPYFASCHKQHTPTGTSLLFTRDLRKFSGAAKDLPILANCYHLSLSFWDMKHRQVKPLPYNLPLGMAWVQAFFKPEHLPLVFQDIQTQQYASGADVRHYRLFTDTDFKPITDYVALVYAYTSLRTTYKTWPMLLKEIETWTASP